MKILEEISSPFGSKIELYECVESTNDTIRGSQYGHGDVVCALYQTKGRGQKGNKWSAESGLNLIFSLLLCPEGLLASEQFQLSKAVALALSQTLDSYGITTSIKWPNDIYVGRLKIAGTLIEANVSGSHIGKVVVGIGINVNQAHFAPDLPNPTSLLLESGSHHELTELTGRLYKNLMLSTANIAKQGEQLNEEYLSKLYLRGILNQFRDEHGNFWGTIQGVDQYGRLTLLRGDGSTKSYGLKEISTL